MNISFIRYKKMKSSKTIPKIFFRKVLHETKNVVILRLETWRDSSAG